MKIQEVLRVIGVEPLTYRRPGTGVRVRSLGEALALSPKDFEAEDWEVETADSAAEINALVDLLGHRIREVLLSFDLGGTSAAQVLDLMVEGGLLFRPGVHVVRSNQRPEDWFCDYVGEFEARMEARMAESGTRSGTALRLRETVRFLPPRVAEVAIFSVLFQQFWEDTCPSEEVEAEPETPPTADPKVNPEGPSETISEWYDRLGVKDPS